MDVSDIVHQGWLTKSPPLERQAHAFFKARWRRRWFVLVSGRDPGSYLLHYFTDPSRRRLKGSIFLEECEQVDSGVSFENKYEFTFNIKTPKRVYYLAADSFEDMNSWVKYVCTACGLRASNDELESVNASSSYCILPKTPSTRPPGSSISSPYILMSECISGPPLSGAYANGGRSSSSEGDGFRRGEEDGDDSSVFEGPSPLRPCRPPKPPHLSTLNELIQGVCPPDVSRELKPGRTMSECGSRVTSHRFMTMGPPVPRTLKPKGSSSTSSLTMPRAWTHHSADEASNSESGSRRNSSQEEQIYYYISTVGSSDNYPPVMIPAESFENKSIAYIDLELPDSSESSKPPPSNPASSIIYKTVDFIKTNAFNRTRENVEARYDGAQLQQNA